MYVLWEFFFFLSLVEEVRTNAAVAKLLQIQLVFTIRGLMDLGVAGALYATSQVHSQVVLVK